MIMLALLAGVIFVVYLFGHNPITLDMVKQQRSALQQAVQSHYLLSLALFFLVYLVTTTLALPIAALLTLLGGFLFGTIVGTCIVITAATVGSIFLFLGIRYLFQKPITSRYQEQSLWLDQHIKKYGSNYLLAVRLAAIIPFFIVNIIAGLTSLPLTTYAWTTFVGIIPGTFVYAFAGRHLGNIQSIADIFTTPIMLSFLLLGLLALLPAILKMIKASDSRS
jgi:uncharacterized membrane protein YdjX (TVP38/TMEM64 family)